MRLQQLVSYLLPGLVYDEGRPWAYQRPSTENSRIQDPVVGVLPDTSWAEKHFLDRIELAYNYARQEGLDDDFEMFRINYWGPADQSGVAANTTEALETSPHLAHLWFSNAPLCRQRNDGLERYLEYVVRVNIAANAQPEEIMINGPIESRSEKYWDLILAAYGTFGPADLKSETPRSAGILGKRWVERNLPGAQIAWHQGQIAVHRLTADKKPQAIVNYRFSGLWSTKKAMVWAFCGEEEVRFNLRESQYKTSPAKHHTEGKKHL